MTRRRSTRRRSMRRRSTRRRSTRRRSTKRRSTRRRSTRRRFGSIKNWWHGCPPKWDDTKSLSSHYRKAYKNKNDKCKAKGLPYDPDPKNTSPEIKKFDLKNFKPHEGWVYTPGVDDANFQ